MANFVSTLDGVVSFNIPGQSGGAQISGSNEADRFIMGLLRASADAVLVGAGTVHAVAPSHLWIAEFVYPAARDGYARYRHEILHKLQHPLIAIVSGSGRLDLDRSVFHTSNINVLTLRLNSVGIACFAMVRPRFDQRKSKNYPLRRGRSILARFSVCSEATLE